MHQTERNVAAVSYKNSEVGDLSSYSNNRSSSGSLTCFAAIKAELIMVFLFKNYFANHHLL
jgi:hypothetical protein